MMKLPAVDRGSKTLPCWATAPTATKHTSPKYPEHFVSELSQNMQVSLV